MANKKCKPTFKKALKRRIVASGVIAGHSTKEIARHANTSQRTVQRIAAEPETQFLIAKAFQPYHALLNALAGRVLDVVEGALRAMKTDEEDHITRLKAVERYCELSELAQGKLPESKPNTGASTLTWEEFKAMYLARERKELAQTETVG